jgi:hypothetical protein
MLCDLPVNFWLLDRAETAVQLPAETTIIQLNIWTGRECTLIPSLPLRIVAEPFLHLHI